MSPFLFSKSLQSLRGEVNELFMFAFPWVHIFVLVGNMKVSVKGLPLPSRVMPCVSESSGQSVF